MRKRHVGVRSIDAPERKVASRTVRGGDSVGECITWGETFHFSQASLIDLLQYNSNASVDCILKATNTTIIQIDI